MTTIRRDEVIELHGLLIDLNKEFIKGIKEGKDRKDLAEICQCMKDVHIQLKSKIEQGMA